MPIGFVQQDFAATVYSVEGNAVLNICYVWIDFALNTTDVKSSIKKPQTAPMKK